MPGTDASLDYWNQIKYQVDPVGSTGNAYSSFGSGGVSDAWGNPITGNEFNFNNSTGFNPGFWDASLNATTNLNQNQQSIWGGNEVNPSQSFQSTIPQYGETTTNLSPYITPNENQNQNQNAFPQYPAGFTPSKVDPDVNFSETIIPQTAASGSASFGIQMPNFLGDPKNAQFDWQKKNLGLLDFSGTGTTGTGTTGTVGQVDTAGSGVPPTVAAPELTPEQLQYQSRVKALQGAGQSMSKFGSSMLGKEYEYNMFG